MDGPTADFYRERGREWADSLPQAVNPGLDAFLDSLPRGARILEMGCGDGRDAARMIERGYAVDASDGSPEMAKLAGERLGRVVPVLRFEEIEAEAEYDAAWCHATLLHVAEEDLPGVLARIHRALKPGGLHCASFKDGSGGGRDQFGRFYSYLPAERLEAAYRASAPWSELAVTTRYDGRSFGGAATNWHTVTARK